MLKLILFDAKPAGRHETFRVDDDAVEVIGRTAPRLRMPDTRVSRAHAEVRVQNGVWVIRDLGSANGTLVNNRAIDGLCELEEDDVIQVGRATLVVAVARVEAAAADPAAGPGPDDTASAAESFGVEAADPAPTRRQPDGDDHSAPTLEQTPPSASADAEPTAPAPTPPAAGALGDNPSAETSDQAASSGSESGESPPPDEADDGDDDEAADAEPSGLRLANYDVLDDDELAEVLAADAPPAVPVADTPVDIAFPDPDAEPLPGDAGLLLDVDPDSGLNADVDATGTDLTGIEYADAHDPLDPPRRGAASADSRLITPAPESPLGSRRQANGFPWRGTAAAVLTLAAAGTGALLLSRGGLGWPLTPVTGTPTATRAPVVDQDPSPGAAAPARPTARRGQPSPFDAGPLLTAPITPRTPTPRVDPPAPRPQPPQATPTPKPVSAPAVAAAQQPTPTPPAPTPTPAIATPTPQPAADPSPSLALALVPTAARPAPAPRPAAPLLPDVGPEPPPDTVSAAAVSAPLAAPRRVVYVVDASGSMVDSMNQGVLTWLETQIGSLRPADAFSVIFFHDAEVLETPPAGLKPGRRAEQVKALDWMAPESGNMRPRGRSRPLAALRLAATYGANEVVLLTDDNFGLRSGEDVSPEALAEVLRPANSAAAMPTVHAVQFFYEDSEGRLKAISSLFGGRYQFIEEPPFEARPIIDDLLDG